MMSLFLVIIMILVMVLIFRASLLPSTLSIKNDRTQFIDSYIFPQGIEKKLLEEHSHLNEDQIKLVIQGLREYFHICLTADKRSVAMPSQAVDFVWHEFILFTRLYDKFCYRAFGRFLHHVPTEAMVSNTTQDDGIKRAWRISCERENISPKKPTKLPLLFAIDDRMNISNGFNYKLNCKTKTGGRSDYCVTHIACASGCAGESFYDSSMSDSTSVDSSSSSNSSSDSSSSGGSGCGSSCGGGGE